MTLSAIQLVVCSLLQTAYIWVTVFIHSANLCLSGELRLFSFNVIIDMFLFKSIFLFVGDLGRALEARSSSVSKQPFCRGKIHVGMIKWEQPRLAVCAQLSSSPQILHYPSHGIQ